VKVFRSRKLKALQFKFAVRLFPFPATLPKVKLITPMRIFAAFYVPREGSLAELETQILIAERLHYVKSSDGKAVTEQIHEVSRIISGLMSSLQKDQQRLGS
jgi:hypothetical protein